jgi:hypothetical protein
MDSRFRGNDDKDMDSRFRGNDDADVFPQFSTSVPPNLSTSVTEPDSGVDHSRIQRAPCQ